MASMFKNAQKSNGRELPGGQFITMIANRLKVLNATIIKYFARPIETEIKKEAVFMGTMLIKRIDGCKFRLYEEYEGKDGMVGITRTPGIVFGSPPKKRKGSLFEKGESSGTTLEHVSR